MYRVLIIGDECIDRYAIGNCTRIAPDGPFPVFDLVGFHDKPGMAGNVAANLRSFPDVEVVLISNDVKQIKERFVDNRTQQTLLRVDSINAVESCEETWGKIEDIGFKQFDAIIISDYDKGFVSNSFISDICSNHGKVFIDTKRRVNYNFENCFILKINEEEFKDNYEYITNNENLKRKVVVTRGNMGCRYKENDYPVKDVEVKDMTGAGDTFLAALVWGYLKYKDISVAITVANKYATQVVQKRGTSILEYKEDI